jgi:cysteine desulfurase
MAGVLASMGAACNAASVDPSHVVEAIGVPPEYKRGTLRFSFGRDTTEEEAKQAAKELAMAIEKSR